MGEPTSFMDAYAFIKALSIEKNIDSVSIVVNMANDAADALNSYNSFQKIVFKVAQCIFISMRWGLTLTTSACDRRASPSQR